MVTTRTDSIALIFAKVIKKKKKIVKLEGLEKDERLQLINSHAFVGIENPNDHENLRVIARDIVKKLLGYPLAAKVIGGVDLDERRRRKVIESNLLGRNSINSILRLRSIATLKELRIMDNDELVSFPNEAGQWFLKVKFSLSELQFGRLKSLVSPFLLGKLFFTSETIYWSCFYASGITEPSSLFGTSNNLGMSSRVNGVHET
ncbi:hypothetical protein MA16_Dca011403 [Dendrobium catenatum]|uniref:Uncharacterized protein n=1 Tax=Dendrobium catenatum TaxID=906689 RepID=A0A2I0WP09_9ASPA|nr:hypothetical protein MA16_Dca011403 [Dendrobium catenatum]